MYAGLVDGSGSLQLYEGMLRFRDGDGRIAADKIAGPRYAEFIGEAAVPTSYLKAPYYKPLGYPDGIYRVGPLARLNVADRCNTLEADTELTEYRQRFGATPQSSFLYHYARLIELMYALERMEQLLGDSDVLSKRVRAQAGVNAAEGVGMIEAPRGVLLHHYKVDETGAIVWANLIVATGHNNMAMSRSVGEVAKHYVDGTQLKEGMLNRVSAVVRAYDPCLSCSTHDLNGPSLRIELVGPDGTVLDTLASQ
jgi:NAD-reducing hydrogenase large subunit